MTLALKTKRLIEKFEADGYQIIIGNNPNLPKTSKYRLHECHRLCLTNAKTHGWTVRTVWAVRPAYQSRNVDPVVRYAPLFEPGSDYAKRAHLEYKRSGGKVNRPEFLERIAEMHHFMESACIHGEADYLESENRWMFHLGHRMQSKPYRESRRLFNAVDFVTTYS